MSPKKKVIGSSTLKIFRNYSTSSTNSFSLCGINNHEPIKFDSLEIACEDIKFKYLGVSGVYKLTNKSQVNRFYIGSSINLARRMEEYLFLTKGIRSPRSTGELEIYQTPASE